MKYIVNFAFTFLVSIITLAQSVKIISVKGSELSAFTAAEEYKYPEFLKARVYLNNGDRASGKFNFNYFDQSMRFITEKGDTLITDEKELDFITIASDTFFYNNSFYEWIATSSKTRLAVKHIFKLIAKENIGPYGITSRTSGVQNIEKFFGVGRSYNASPNEVLVFSKETTYYISNIQELKNDFVVANKKNISKFLPKNALDNYLKANKADLNKEKDLIDLMVYISREKN